MSKPDFKPVPVPVGQRLRHLRTTVVPVAVWLAAVGAAGFIATMKLDTPTPITGIVEVRESHLAPAITGRLATLEVTLHQKVQPGDIVARLDDTQLAAELATARAELARLRAEPLAVREELRRDDARREQNLRETISRLALEVEDARLDVLDRIATLQVDRIEVTRLDAALARLETLLQDAIIDEATYEDTFYARQARAAAVKEGESALVAAEQRLDAARQELEEHRRRSAQEEPASADAIIVPLREAITVQEALLSQLTTQREALVVRSPASGRVTMLLAEAGQNVFEGEPFVVITNDQPERVVAYVTERMLDRVADGTRVIVQTRRQPPTAFEGRVASVGGRMDPFPEQLQRNPLHIQYGLAVLIEGVPVEGLYPGETLNIRVAP